MSIENVVLEAVSLILWGELLFRSIRMRHYMLVVFLISFSMHYIFPPLYVILVGHTTNRYLSVISEGGFIARIAILLFLSSIYLGLFISKELVPDSSTLYLKYKTPTRINYRKSKIILLAISLFTILLQYNSFSYLLASGLMSDRLIYNQGKGYLQLFNIASYFLVFFAIKQYSEGKIKFGYLVIHAIPAFIIYALKLQRGHSLYPLFFIFIAYAFLNIPRRYLFPLFSLGLLSLLYIAPITNELRRGLVATGELSMKSISISEVIPASYAHAELLTAITEDRQLEGDVGEVFWGTIINFIPRGFFESKPSSLGPVLSAHYTKDSYQYLKKGNHRSSFTTDLLIEGYFYAGLVGVFLGGLLYFFLINKAWFAICNGDTEYSFLLLPLGLFLLGYTIFFSDLGNWIGYVVLFYSEYFVIKKCKI